ncbi:hypothetical protein JVU11DRAFT_7062 [Chiua virens]|nr:hypothetical protein JVU11DRAFT_7062 [Chiua virens]
MSQSTPGRTTRNSTYGRPSLSSSSKPRKSPVRIKSLPESAPAYDSQAECNTTPVVDNEVEDTWFACRDSDGCPTSVALSETGKGIHVRWQYPSNDNDGDAKAEEEDAAEVEMMVGEAHDIVTPSPTAARLLDAHRPLTFPKTPIARDRYEPGSVVLTPVKKSKPLQPSPAFVDIGDATSVRSLHGQDGVLRIEHDYPRFGPEGAHLIDSTNALPRVAHHESQRNSPLAFGTLWN